MVIDPRIKTQYSAEEISYNFILRILDQTLLSYTRKNNFAYSSRVKGVSSLAEKIETGRFKNWDEIDDKIASTIIIPNQIYSEDVVQYLENTFTKVQIRKATSTFKDPSVFRFGNTIFTGTLKPINPHESSLNYKIKFEVQVKTAFEHAWSVATHDLTYKSSEIDWKLLRLASTIKSSVEQLDMIILGAKENSKNIPEHKWPEINVKQELLDFYKDLFVRKIIPEELYPKDFNRIIETLYHMIKFKIDLWKPRKWKADLDKITDALEKGMAELGNPSFPISISLLQASLGILLSEKVITKNEIKYSHFLIADIFVKLFPGISKNEIKLFEINSA